MKKIRVEAVVYDAAKQEYVTRWVQRGISDELAEALVKELAWNGSPYEAGNNEGSGLTTYDEPDGSRARATPVRDRKRYRIDPRFYIVDDEGEEEKRMFGWRWS